MARRSGTWMVVAVLFTVVNVAGAVYAAWLSEPMHAAGHVALSFLGVYWVRWLNGGRPGVASTEGPSEADRIAELQQSVDAVALEVERIGEAQRFAEKLQAAREAVRHPEAK